MSAHENLEVFAHRPDDLTTDVAGLRAGKPGHDGRTQRRILGIEFVLGALRFRYAGSMSGYLARSALGWAHRARGVALVGVEQDVFGLRAPPRGTAAAGPAVDLPDVLGNPRQRPQRRQVHSRCRAGGENNRLWSPHKTATRCGRGC
jgi:hypothetical protein